MVHLKTRPEVHLNESFFPQSFNTVISALMDERRAIAGSNDFIPSADILETDSAFEIKLSLAGMKKADLKISLEGELLKVEGEKKHEDPSNNSKFIKREIRFGKFSRSFKVGKTETTKIEAEFEDGILTILLPKRAEEKPSQINIK